MRYLIAGFLCLCAATLQAEPAKTPEKPNSPIPRVEIRTNLGKITLELMPDQAPISVENFVTYAQAGFYRGTIFHRVLNGFLVQGGGYTANFEAKPPRPPIINEANNGLKNTRGTIAMARLPDPNSATSQFFINTTDNTFLDQSTTQDGYAVFGKVVEGMEVVDKIQIIPIKAVEHVGKNVPVETVVIEDVKIENLPAPVKAETKPVTAEKPPVKSEPPIAEVKAEKPKELPNDGKKEKTDKVAEVAKPAAAKVTEKPVEKVEAVAPKMDSKTASDKKPEIYAPAPDEPSSPDMPIPMMR